MWLRGRNKEKTTAGERSPSNPEVLDPRPQIFLDMKNSGIPDFTSNLTIQTVSNSFSKLTKNCTLSLCSLLVTNHCINHTEALLATDGLYIIQYIYHMCGYMCVHIYI